VIKFFGKSAGKGDEEADLDGLTISTMSENAQQQIIYEMNAATHLQASINAKNANSVNSRMPSSRIIHQ